MRTKIVHVALVAVVAVPEQVSRRPARQCGAGGVSRETDSIFSTLRARRAGHGARARARLATGGSPVDSPSAEASVAEICLAMPSRKRPAGRKKHDFTLLNDRYQVSSTQCTIQRRFLLEPKSASKESKGRTMPHIALHQVPWYAAVQQ